VVSGHAALGKGKGRGRKHARQRFDECMGHGATSGRRRGRLSSGQRMSVSRAAGGGPIGRAAACKRGSYFSQSLVSGGVRAQPARVCHAPRLLLLACRLRALDIKVMYELGKHVPLVPVVTKVCVVPRMLTVLTERAHATHWQQSTPAQHLTAVTLLPCPAAPLRVCCACFPPRALRPPSALPMHACRPTR
jgi:hypothetical protein